MPGRPAVISPLPEEKNQERMPLLFFIQQGYHSAKSGFLRRPSVENDVNAVKDVKESYKNIPRYRLKTLKDWISTC